MFIKFKEAFYPSSFVIGKDLINYSYLRESSPKFAQREFWDETFGQTTECNVLGIFCYGLLCDQYIQLFEEGGKEAVVKDVLTELDTMFGGEATRQYLQSEVQLW